MATKFDVSRAMLTVEQAGGDVTAANIATIVGDTQANVATFIAQVTADRATALSAVNTLRSQGSTVNLANVAGQSGLSGPDLAEACYALYYQGTISPSEWSLFATST